MTLRGLGSRLSKLERETKKTDAPTFADFSAAAEREGARRIRGALERLARLPSLDGSPVAHLGRDNREVLVDDTPEQRRRDERTIEAWSRGVDLKAEADTARARLLAMRR